MNYNDKLKLAKEALDSGSYDKETIEYIFPELAESKDGRIKKAIEYAIGQSTHSDGTLINGVSSEEALAWLEKQSEQILANSAKTCKDEQKPAWSEEDEGMINCLIATLCEEEHGGREVNDRFVVWLESLKGRVFPQSKQEWSEEDKMMLQYAIEHFERQKRNCIEGGGRRKVMQEFIDWLKSLKDRYTWKPSGEQMKALRYAAEKDGCNHVVLIGLISDLEKLTEYSYEK